MSSASEPSSARLARVVHHHLQHRLVALAQEARHVRAHHQLLHAPGLALERAALQVPRQRVHPDVPRRHRVRHGELQHRRAVLPREQLRHPEGRLREVRAHLFRWHLGAIDAKGGVVPGEARVADGALPPGAPRVSAHRLLMRFVLARHQHVRRHPQAQQDVAPPGPDAVSALEHEPIPLGRGPVRHLPEIPAVERPVGGELPRAAAQLHVRQPLRVVRRHARGLVGREELQRLIVHVREQLGGSLLHPLPPRSLHRHPPGLLRSRAQPVAEGGELQLQLLVIEGHRHRLGEAQHLVVPHRHQREREAATQGLGDRELQQRRLLPSGEPAPLHEPLPPVDVQEQRLALEAGEGQHARRLAHPHRGALHPQQRRQGNRARSPTTSNSREVVKRSPHASSVS